VRAKPDLWTGADRIQWGCVLMHMLGESNLELLPVVLSGLRSVEWSRQVAPYQAAVQTARTLLGDLLTKRAVQSAVAEFLSVNRGERSFDIDEDTLVFRARSEYDPAIKQAEAVLREGLSVRTRALDLADTTRDLIAGSDPERRVRLRLHGLTFPHPEQHDLRRQPAGPITVHWSELEALAAELDAADAGAGRSSENWTGRLANTRLQVTTGTGLHPTDVLQLAGLKHLIGLPGSGKTTLIMLLCILLERRRLRVAAFFTAIEVAREYLEKLRRYGVRTALLVGRSTDTHLRHGNDLAELIAMQGRGGFAQTRDGIDLLAQSCPLPAFAESWPSENEWRLGEAPCERIYEAGSKTPKLCPAWSLCGRVKNQRELVHASVWLGHLLSADTMVPRHTCTEHLRYFELVARTFDLVIVDECDESQKVLDAHGALTLKLTGDDQSIHISLQQTAGLLAANRARISDGMLRYIQRANEFERHTLRFVDEIRRLQKARPDLAYRYSEKLLTASFLLREALEAAGQKEAFAAEAQSALSDLWETAMYRAFFERGDEAGAWRKAPRHAPALGLSPDAGDAVWQRLNRALKRYLALDHAASSEKPIAEVVAILTELLRAPGAERIAPQIRLLIAVGFTIASYQRLAKDARPLARRGEVPEASDLVFSKVSGEMREVVPRSILGTFSSVRYRQAAGTDGLEIDYLVMDSTPRLLLHRLHEVGGANVLLASATSWLEPASQYHVGKPPDIVLSTRTPELGPLRLYFQPKPHPGTKKPLRFSGSGYEREENLRHMVTALVASGPGGSSDLERTVRGIRTELGKPRKAALVVNSYEQVRLVVEQIRRVNPDLADRTRGVLRELPADHSRKHYVLRGQVEGLGPDTDVDILVFPLGALGRGTNIVFTAGDADRGKAAIGSVFFLTRPHPAAGDLSLMLSLLARCTERLDSEDLRALRLAEVRARFDQHRYAVFRQIARLLARPMSASQLDDETLPVFAANLLVGVLQTIGRGMRMPVEVYFVDAAWAPNSAEGRPDTKRSSVLVAMRDVLAGCLSTRDPDQHDIYEKLYKDFAKAFREIDGVIFPGGPVDDDIEDFSPSPAGLEDAMDGWEPEDHVELDDVGDEDNEMALEEAAR
jgi:hypothetical protein